MRVNMVPRDGGNQFRGQFFGNYAGESFTSDNCESAGFVNGVAQPCTRSNLTGSTTFNREQHAHQRRRRPEDLGRQSVDRRPDQARQAVVPLHVPPLGHGEDQGRRVRRHATRRRSSTVADTTTPGIDDGHIVSNAVRVSWAVSSKDKISVYHDNQRKYRDHWGIAANDPARGGRDPGDADQLRQRHEVDAHAHQPVAARGAASASTTRSTPSSISRASPASSDKVWDYEAIRNSTRLQRHRHDRTTATPTPGPAPPITSRRCGRSWARRRTSPGSHNFRFGAHVHQRRLAADRGRGPATCSRSPTTRAVRRR